MLHPWLNQKVLWPLLHTLVPFVHGAFLASIVPMGGCLPPLNAGVSESIAFLGGGMIMLECAWTVVARAAVVTSTAVLSTIDAAPCTLSWKAPWPISDLNCVDLLDLSLVLSRASSLDPQKFSAGLGCSSPGVSSAADAHTIVVRHV
jgi:hypothetical protein